ncbi:TspO/MBR family protein [Oryzifoliimicrobium ureilyticus]|uniref:TspO/MBR family protein n=1 Tax=Oryzifoliimicrobium ureilyticus TaxID=3113724 RepID=UPI0030767C9B
MKKPVIYLIFICIVVGLGLLSGLNNLPGEWYRALNKPSFNPPNWIFGPVWTTLYVLIGIAGARLWMLDRHGWAMKLWFLSLVLNLLWSPAFFGQESAALGLAVIIPLLLSIYAYIPAAWKSDRAASILFWPYALWVSFATVLNFSIFLLNR